MEKDALKVAQEIKAEYWAVSSLTGELGLQLSATSRSLLHLSWVQCSSVPLSFCSSCQVRMSGNSSSAWQR